MNSFSISNCLHFGPLFIFKDLANLYLSECFLQQSNIQRPVPLKDQIIRTFPSFLREWKDCWLLKDKNLILGVWENTPH